MRVHPFLAGTSLLLALLTACRPDADVPPCDCEPLPAEPPSGYQYTQPPAFQELPVAHPRNITELAYLRFDTNRPEVNGLWCGNRITRQQRQLLSGRGIFQDLDWSIHNWLLLHRNNQVWKITSRGDSLTQLTTGVPHYDAWWRPDGRAFVCREEGNSAQQHRLVVFSDTGTRLLEIGDHTFGRPFDWSPDGNQLAVGMNAPGGKHAIGLYDLATRQTRLLVESELQSSAAGIISWAAWSSDGRVLYWVSGRGVFRTIVATSQTRCLRSACTSRLYRNLSLAADGRLLLQRLDQRVLPDGRTVHAEVSLVLMDPETGTEEPLAF